MEVEEIEEEKGCEGEGEVYVSCKKIGELGVKGFGRTGGKLDGDGGGEGEGSSYIAHCK